MVRLRIKLGRTGNSEGNEIIDLDTGKSLPVRSLKIESAVDDVTRVTLDLVGVEVEGDVEGRIVPRETETGEPPND